MKDREVYAEAGLTDLGVDLVAERLKYTFHVIFKGRFRVRTGEYRSASTANVQQ